MYLFTRSARLRPGHLQESLAWSVRMTEKVNQIGEVTFTLWTPVFSAGVGSLTWVTMTEELAALEATEAKLMADAGCVELMDEGAKFVADSGVDDSLWQMVYADPDGANADPQYVYLVAGVLAPGHAVRGIELGVEIAQRAKQITGRPTAFSVAETGAYGAVEWSAVAESVQQLQTARQALASDRDFAQFLDREAATAYLPEGSQVIVRKVA
jgi:hypothetical protein